MALRVLYHDVDRLPYLLLVRDCARARGLELTLIEHERRGEDWAEVLRRGEADAIAESYWRLQRYHAAGAPFVALASAVHAWTELLLVRPGIAGLEDLRGKRLAVRGTGPQAVFPTVFLRDAGLLGAVDLTVYSEKETGRWGHWKKVVEGECDGCFLLPLYADDARAAGLLSIPYPAFAFDGAHVTVTTTETILGEKHAALAGFVRAMFEAVEIVRSDPQRLHALVRDEAREALSAHFDVSSADKLARVAELLASEVWEPPVPTISGLQNALRLARESYPELEGYEPPLMWDFALLREARPSP